MITTINDLRLLIYGEYSKYRSLLTDDNIARILSYSICGNADFVKESSIRLALLYYYAISTSKHITIPKEVKEMLEKRTPEEIVSIIPNNIEILVNAISTIIKNDISENDGFNPNKHYLILEDSKPSPIYKKLHPCIEKEMQLAEDHNRTRILVGNIVKTKIRTFADFLNIYFGNYNSIEESTNRLVILKAIIASTPNKELKDKIQSFIISNFYSLGYVNRDKETRKNTTDIVYETLKNGKNIPNDMLLIFSMFPLEALIQHDKELKKSDIKDLEYIRNYR